MESEQQALLRQQRALVTLEEQVLAFTEDCAGRVVVSNDRLNEAMLRARDALERAQELLESMEADIAEAAESAE